MTTFRKSTVIAAPPSTIWDALSTPAIIPQWMGDAAMNLKVATTWRVPSGTSLTLTMDNFPTHEIFKHMEFYWTSTLELFRQFVESMPNEPPGGTSAHTR